MINPFDKADTDDITKQEIANFVFLGSKERFEKVQFSYDDLEPHLLQHYMDYIINSENELRKQARDFYSLLDVLFDKFLILNNEMFLSDTLSFSTLSSCDQEFLIRLLKKEISLREAIKQFKKRGGVISLLLKNKLIANDLLKKILAYNELNFCDLNKTDDYLMAHLFIDCDALVKVYNNDKLNEYEKLINYIKLLLKFEYYPYSKIIVPSISKELHITINSYYKLMFSLISSDINEKSLYDFDTKKFKFRKLAPIPENQVVFRNNCLLLQNINFKDDESDRIFEHIISNRFKYYNFVGFKDCCFDRNILLEDTYVNSNLYFEGCTFNKKYQVKYCKIGTLLRFSKCTFFGKLIFGKNSTINYLPCNIEIRDSTFKPYSSIEISNITAQRQFNYGKVALINTIFNGNVKFTNLSQEANTLFSIHNIAITTPFVIEKCFFNKDSVIDGISFSLIPKQAMNGAIKTFSQSLEDSGLRHIAIENGLLAEASNDDDNDANIDIQAYKIACDSGFLKPKHAAYFLAMSKDNLAKKRMADKKQITRESIPYVGEGKSIVYPIDALQAFKASDWALLKELRERYAKNESDDDF